MTAAMSKREPLFQIRNAMIRYSMDPVRHGQRAAWTILAVALGVYVAAATVIRVTQADPNCQRDPSAHPDACEVQAVDRATQLAMVALGIGFFGLLGAWSKSQELPPESRKAFWLTGLVCMALSGFLWFSICVRGMW